MRTSVPRSGGRDIAQPRRMVFIGGIAAVIAVVAAWAPHLTGAGADQSRGDLDTPAISIVIPDGPTDVSVYGVVTITSSTRRLLRVLTIRVRPAANPMVGFTDANPPSRQIGVPFASSIEAGSSIRVPFTWDLSWNDGTRAPAGPYLVTAELGSVVAGSNPPVLARVHANEVHVTVR